MKQYQLWMDRPAINWEDTTPLGNGRLGMSVNGGTDREVFQLNEENIWNGGPREKFKVQENFPKLVQELRDMLLKPITPQTKREEVDADTRANQVLLGNEPVVKSYETAGEIFVDFKNEGEVSEYARVLDMKNGVLTVSYRKGGLKLKEEAFVSYDPSIYVMKLTAEEGTLDLDLTYARMAYDCALPWDSVGPTKQIIALEEDGIIADSATGDEQHTLQVKMKFYTDGTANQIRNGHHIAGAKTVIIYAGAAFEKEAEVPCKPDMATYTAIYKKHTARFSEIMERSYVSFGQDEAGMPINERMKAMKDGAPLDKGVIDLYYTFGRYLLLSSSYGKDTLPANLQGVWNPYVGSPWNCDYHTNINLQMNYWPAEVANLSECAEPLFRYMNEYLLPGGKKAAKDFYHARGMVVHHLSDTYQFAAPADGVWGLWPMGGAWLAYAMWEHYLFTKDVEFLRTTAYEYIKECVIFFFDYLFEHPKYPGRLLSGPSNSPENIAYRLMDQGEENRMESYLAISPTMDTEILSGLFEMYIKTEELLQIDPECAQKAKEVAAKLMPLQIGKDGRLLEWIEEYEEAEPGHRHISHAFGLHPGWQITENTPELMAALRKSFAYRLSHGGGHTGWSCAWLINLYARLHDGAGVGNMFYKLLTQSTNENLYDSHPPFQIDGNFGATAAVAEMLVQSHTDVIELLPALPENLSTGSFVGIMARGGLEISASFADGKVTALSLYAKCAGDFTLLVNGEKMQVTLAKGERKECTFA